MARASLAAVIATVRGLIGDPAGASQVFTDDDVQAVLDRRRRDVWLIELAVAPTVAFGGVITYLDYYADGGNWETDAVLQDNVFKVLTNATSPVAVATAGCDVGRWTLSASLNPPVWLTGKQYDPNGAAADLLESWIAKLKLEFDFLSTGRTFKRHQQVLALADLAERYRRRQWLGYSQMVRTDMNAGDSRYV